MEREGPNEQNKPSEEKKEGYIIVPNYFLKEWVSILGVGPVVLYQELLTYCHKGKYIAWPTINSLCQEMGIAKTTLFRYQNTLSKFGLVKNISRGKSTTGHYRNNIYQITPLEKLPEHPNYRYQNDTYIGSETIPLMVSKRYPNNTNLNITNSTTANGEKDAVVVAVNFKKLKEKGEKMRAPYNSKEHYTGQAIRERMIELDFEEEFIEKVLKEYSLKKIDAKLDLLMEKKNIKSPAGWLMVALKNNYQDAKHKEEASYESLQPSLSFRQPSLSFPRKRESITPAEEPAEENENDISRGVQYAPPTEAIANNRREGGNLNSQSEWDNILTTEEARKRFKLLREKLMAMDSP